MTTMTEHDHAADEYVTDERDRLMKLGFPSEERRTEPAQQRAARARRPRAVRLRDQIGDLAREERGAVTAEYALIITAAVAFAGVLILIVRSDEVRQMLLDLVQSALGGVG